MILHYQLAMCPKQTILRWYRTRIQNVVLHGIATAIKKKLLLLLIVIPQEK